MTSIGASAFSGCSSLTSVDIPNSVTSIGDRAFLGCSSLTSVTISNSVTSIGRYTFSGCSNLPSVTIPNSVTSIGDYAFTECYGLTSVNIPNSLTTFGDYAFSKCSGLIDINVDADNPNYCVSDNVLFDKDVKSLIFCVPGKTGAYIIPNSVTSIGRHAFYACKGLTSVTIPNSVTSIGYSAFAYCDNLKEIISYILEPFAIDSYVFLLSSIAKDRILFVPQGTEGLYKNTSGWNNIKNIVEMEDTENTFDISIENSEDSEVWNDLSRVHNFVAQGTYKHNKSLKGMIEYAIEDSEEWHKLTEMMPSGSAFNNSFEAMFDEKNEKHLIRFRAIDTEGNIILLPTIEYLDVSFHKYSGVTEKIYTGEALFQEVKCSDVANLQVTTGNYKNNINAGGTASFDVEGVFPYTIGRKAYTFRIAPASLTGEIDIATERIIYNGQQQKPEWSFTNESYGKLENGKDYYVSYIDNVNPGTAKIRVNGIGNYTSELVKTFIIDKAQLKDELYTIVLPDEDVNYNGSEHKASATVKNGVGEVKFTYTLHGRHDALPNAPVNEGHYDVYCEIADGDLYYGKTNEYIGSFTIYRFDDAEWQSLCLLYSDLKQMNASFIWEIEGGVKNVDTFEGLKVEKGHVVGASFASKGLTGQFPTTLMALSKLEYVDLSDNNLLGDIATAVAAVKQQNPNAFEKLYKLDISNNNLNGNICTLAQCMPNITTLNASNNKFEDIYPALPASITNLDISNQKMDRVVELNMSDLSLEDFSSKVPTILLYDKVNRTYKNSINLLCTKADLATFNKYDTKEWAMQLQIDDNQLSIPYVSAQKEYYGESGDTLNVLNMTGNDATDGSSFRIALSFNQGDANFINGVDATDLQTTILYAFGGYRNYPFNFTAADTYKDGIINVQDVICTVNILLDSHNEQAMEARSKKVNMADMEAKPDTDAYLYVKDGKVFLHSQVPVASLSIKADGNVKWNIERLGLSQSTANGNVVAYSLNGTTIPSYEDVVLGECTHAKLYSVSLSDTDAQPISVNFGNSATSIINTSNATNGDMKIYDVSGYRLNKMRKGINIIRNNGTTKKIYK